MLQLIALQWDRQVHGNMHACIHGHDLFSSSNFSSVISHCSCPKISHYFQGFFFYSVVSLVCSLYFTHRIRKLSVIYFTKLHLPTLWVSNSFNKLYPESNEQLSENGESRNLPAITIIKRNDHSFINIQVDKDSFRYKLAFQFVYYSKNMNRDFPCKRNFYITVMKVSFILYSLLNSSLPVYKKKCPA